VPIDVSPRQYSQPPTSTTAALESACANVITEKNEMLTSEIRRQARTCARDRPR
jgi:hypothetical protein